MLIFSCPHCAKNVSVAENLAGHALNCPYCAGPFSIPAESKPPAPFRIDATPAVVARQERQIPATCPYCGLGLDIRGEFAGQAISCPQCNGRFQAPLPVAASEFGSTRGNSHALHPGIRICVLISAILNLLSGALFVFSILGIPIGIPQIVLGIFEISFLNQAERKPVWQSISQAKTLGILEIVSGIFNLGGIVCGILVLVFAHQQRSGR